SARANGPSKPPVRTCSPSACSASCSHVTDVSPFVRRASSLPIAPTVMRRQRFLYPRWLSTRSVTRGGGGYGTSGGGGTRPRGPEREVPRSGCILIVNVTSAPTSGLIPAARAAL